jgi:hypothetical protein
LQEILPRNCLAVRLLEEEKKCEFVFQEDGTIISYPITTLADRMVFDQAGFSTGNEKEQEHRIILEGRITDTNNQFLIAYIQTHAIPEKQLTVSEVGELILFGERFSMVDFIEKIKLAYLLRPNLISKESILSIHLFRIFRRNQQYDLLNDLVRLGGYAKSSEFTERVQLLSPDVQADATLLESCIMALCLTKNVDIILSAMIWAHSNDYEPVHKRICQTMIKQKIITFPSDYLRLVLHGTFNYHLNYPLKYSEEKSEFLGQFRPLYHAFLKSSKTVTVVLNKAIEACIETYIEFLVPSDYEEEDISDRSKEEDNLSALHKEMLPKHILSCLKYKLKGVTSDLTEQESEHLHGFLDRWVNRDEVKFKQLSTSLDECDFTQFTNQKNFVTFAKKSLNLQFKERLISDQKFRKTVVKFTEKKD